MVTVAKTNPEEAAAGISLVIVPADSPGFSHGKALDKIGYQDLLHEQAERRGRGELMGIGISTFTEIVGAGPSDTFDILGIKMFDSAEIRIHPTGSAVVRSGVQTQGQGQQQGQQQGTSSSTNTSQMMANNNDKKTAKPS